MSTYPNHPTISTTAPPPPPESYHYHILPTCLFKSLPIPTPNNPKFWTDPTAMYAKYWPTTAEPSPIVGWALDGHPIFGPYDTTGELAKASDLDKCHGKTEGGAYRYYMSTEAPFMPTCFSGKPGNFKDNITPTIACPARGRCNLPLKALYIFPTSPLLNTPAWKAHSWCFAVFFLFVTFYVYTTGVLAVEFIKVRKKEVRLSV